MSDDPKHVHRFVECREYVYKPDTPRETIQAMPLIGHRLVRQWRECSCGRIEGQEGKETR